MAENTRAEEVRALDSLPLLNEFSLEITGRDISALEDAAYLLPPDTRVNITYLANEDLGNRVEAARVANALGLRPVPHISARRITSQHELEQLLDALCAVGATEEIFVIGGDPDKPAGPYSDSLAIIRSGLLPRYGVRRVGIAGYPDGHPAIDAGTLSAAFAHKVLSLSDQGLEATVITQFGFDTEPVLRWLRDLRRQDIDIPVRVGVSGPAGVKRLLRYASRFGIQSSAGIAHKYGLSLTNLLGTAGPGKFIRTLQDQLDPEQHGKVLLHFYTFGGVRPTAQCVWDQGRG